jgi:hypothetical protein
MTKTTKRDVISQNSRFEKDAFNATQNFLYKRAMFGLGVYSTEEVVKMNIAKKKRIMKVHNRCQSVLNIWKQELCNQYTNRIFETLFPKTEMAKFFYVTHKDTVDSSFMNTLNFKEMGITKPMIVEKLILEGVLPKDFHSLTNAPAKEEKV